jgi:hypothetical protein
MPSISPTNQPFGPTALLAAFALTALAAPNAIASSHREAPFVTEHPKVDGTDFYMFNSYENGREGYVTIVANYLPLQDPYGGPNYFFMDPDATYSIKIDSNGDSREDITFEFKFRNLLKDIALPIGDQTVSVPLINVGPIAKGDVGNLNIIESYSLRVRFGDDPNAPAIAITDARSGSPMFTKPVDNIGLKSIPDYESYAASFIYTIALPDSDLTGRLFVGQRKDPFVVNLGETFDLVNLNPLGPVDGEMDDLANKNVTSLILELPAEWLTDGDEPVIGAWTTAHLHRNRTLSDFPSFQRPAQETGDWVQVSRLAMPLVNELVIGLKDKNRFNASKPNGDGQFLVYVTNPTLPALLNALFGVTPPCLPRNDLVTVFLTGVPGLNQPMGVVPSEMLRLNTTTPPKPKGEQNNLGVIAGDAAGYPNGRRPGDDVVDISLRVVMGVLLDTTCAPSGQLAYTDGAFVDDSFFDDHFPYIRTPVPGSPSDYVYGGAK